MTDLAAVDSKLGELYAKRVEQNRDLVVLVTDANNERGTGKTVLSLQLADAMDRNGGLETDQTSIDPRPLTDLYSRLPAKSSLVLDEAEDGLSKYQSGSAINRALRRLVSMGRVEQKYLVLNAPASHAIDTDLRSLVDVWIIVQRRGFAHLYRVGYNQFADHELTKQIGTMAWNDINNDAPLRDVYDDLTSEKKRRLDGEDDDDAYLQRDEAKQMVEEAEREAKADQRNSVIERMADAGMTQADIAEYVDLSRSRVSQILSERRATRAVGD